MKIGTVQTIIVAHCLDCSWKRNRTDVDVRCAIKHAHDRKHKVQATTTLSSCYDGRQGTNGRYMQGKK